MTGSHARRTFALVAALSFIASAACSDGTGAQSIEGDYVLQTVNGRALPYTHTYPATSASYTVRSERITIRSGATWTSATSHVYVFPGLTRDETNDLDGGTWTYDAPTRLLGLISDASNIIYSANVAGRTLTMYRDGDVYRYER